MNDLKTARGQLAIASEFRFVYWPPDEDCFITVVLGKGATKGRWAICDIDKYGACWNGEAWSFNCRGLDAFRYDDVEEALLIARDLAVERNQEVIANMEIAFAGEFRGGEYDLVTGKGEE